MTLPDLDTSRGPAELLADIRAYVAMAEETVGQREAVSLAGLDVAVAALCERILTLPEAEANIYAVKLEELVVAVESMQAKMITLQAEIATTMKSLATQKKAANAYSNSPQVNDAKVEE